MLTSIKALKQTLLDEFQIKGHWWIPETDNLVSGILFYKKDDITLELIGSLGELGKSISLDIIFGISDKGEKFTLINALNTNITVNMPGFQTDTYSVNSFLVGENIEKLDTIEFDYMIFDPTYFSKWIQKDLYSQEYFAEQEKITGIKAINFKEITLFNVLVKCIDTEVIESYKTDMTGNIYDNINWKYRGGIKIRPKERKNIEWFRETMYKVTSLYTLFIGYPTYLENVTFYLENGDSNKPNKKISYFFKQSIEKTKKKFHARDAIVTYSQISDSFGLIINNWFEKIDLLKDVNNMYQGDYYIDMYLNTRFLNAVQTLEIFHRSLFKGKAMDEKEYQKYSSELTDLLETKFPQEFSTVIKGKLNHGNEYSLSKRLRELVNSLTQESKTYLIGNSDKRGKFVQQLVDTRNYFTHFDLDGKSNVLEIEDELFYAIQRLKALCTLLLFKQIGIDETIALSNIKEHYGYSIEAAKDLLN
ncbi:HEPN domain-containing protein [Peribacillus frigoritolerans]|uniref:ApeA N-terminal domain 1-containing protein n=1 Tax=Peribacillus frigoritolerans TaxID=450367 RepID=UPI0034E09285